MTKTMWGTVPFLGILIVLAGCGGRGERGGADEPSGDRSEQGRRQSAVEEPAGAPAVRVRAEAVEERTFVDAVRAYGQWRSAGQIIVASPFAGGVDSLLLRPGDRVHKGDVLCRLVTRESQAALRGAEMLANQAHDPAGAVEANRALELARREIVRVPIHAPRDGIVTEVAAQAGSEMAESTPLVTIQAPDAIVFEARVDPADAGRVRVGDRASIVDGVTGRSRDAVVRRILPIAGAADQATLIWLEPTSRAEPGPGIGVSGTAAISIGQPRRAPAVPDSALVQDDLTGQVRVAAIDAGSRAVWTPVTVGAAGEGWHELVSSAIGPGTLVIVDGQRGLPDSTRVAPTRSSGAPRRRS